MAMVGGSYFFIPVSIEFYSQTLFSLVEADGKTPVFNFTNPEASEGYRIWLWNKIVEYSVHHPVGAGFGGVWMILPGEVGSAHSQYADILFRTGFPGLLTYVLLLWFVANGLFRSHRGLFYGLLSILVVGLFHETFKESHGSFMLAVMMSCALLGIKDNNLREKRT